MFFEKHPVLFRMRESYRVPINLPKPPKVIPSPAFFLLHPTLISLIMDLFGSNHGNKTQSR